jgi:hypothetical protein
MWEVKFYAASPKEELQVYRCRFKVTSRGTNKARYTFPGPENPKTHANTQFNSMSRSAFSVSNVPHCPWCAMPIAQTPQT